MIKKLLFCILFASATIQVIKAQNIFEGYQDGKVWVKIKNDYRKNINIGENPNNLVFSTLPFMEQLSEEYSVKKLSQPFHAAKNSATLLNTYLIEFDNHSKVMQLISDLEATGNIEYAERVPLDKRCLTPNDPSYSSQWHLTKINAANAWNSFSSGSTIVIAIVDDAIERTHSDLSPSLWVNTGDNNTNGVDDDGNGYTDDINGYDVASNDNNPNPPNNNYDHGTHVAGIATARSNNSTGVASIGYSVKLMCVKATYNYTFISNGYDGIVYAASNGADVINMSWGGTNYSTTAQNVINWAYAQGCILVAGAGNDPSITNFYPAAFNNVIAVAATASNDLIASYSTYGTWIDVSAPGSNIYSTTVGNSYGNKSGTSMASPLVAGLCGLMKSLNPGITQTALINCLKNNTTNINSLNPSYVGKMGTGRIDAAAAMTCVAATLNLPPVADFTANITSIVAGGKVTFTDLSTSNPSTWAWTFNGGTPATFNGKTPPLITYTAVGVYSVTLVAGNGNGSDSEIKTGYITVTAGGGCAILNYPIPSTWVIGNYTAGTTSGYSNGVGSSADKQKAMYFDASAYPYTYLTQVHIAFGKAFSSNLNKIVPIRVYDGTSGSPGTQLASVNTTVAYIKSNVSASRYTSLVFASPVTLPASKRFFISVDISNLSWTAVPKDTLSIISNSDGQTTPSATWEQHSNNTWYRYTTAGSYNNLNISLVMHPTLTSTPAIATYTQSVASICQGNSVSFDATGSTYQDTLLWVFPGGGPTLSSTVQPNVIYNTPGTYPVILYVVGGGCHQLDSLATTVTIIANPVINISTSNNTICPSGSANLSASGASGYTWSPPTGLNTTTGSSVIASPAVTTNYNVTGTANGCSSSSSINVNVDVPPTVVVTTSTVSLCAGDFVSFDASQSTNATTFSWNFPGGSPSSSAASTPQITYSTPGTYTVGLTASNSCSSDNSFTQTITVVPCASGIATNDNEKSFMIIYDQVNREAQLTFNSDLEKATLVVLNSLGELILQEEMGNVSRGSVQTFNLQNKAQGLYLIEVISNGNKYSKKIIAN